MSNQAQTRVADELDAFAMLPSQAAAVFDMILAWTNAHRGAVQSLADRAVLRMLDVQKDCFLAAGVLWTAGMPPGRLQEMDAAGQILVQMAMPQSVLWAFAAGGCDWHLTERSDVHRDVREQIRGLSQI